mmetsp:Transcript_1548/g.2977  ORF Transcript_1548/g.2977 Transcript_1548/m.2977 type:complete len:212 (-) Transcript_1548:45-680(-)
MMGAAVDFPIPLEPQTNVFRLSVSIRLLMILKNSKISLRMYNFVGFLGLPKSRAFCKSRIAVSFLVSPRVGTSIFVIFCRKRASKKATISSEGARGSVFSTWYRVVALLRFCPFFLSCSFALKMMMPAFVPASIIRSSFVIAARSSPSQATSSTLKSKSFLCLRFSNHCLTSFFVRPSRSGFSSHHCPVFFGSSSMSVNFSFASDPSALII